MFRKTTLLVGALALMLVAPQAQAAKGDWMLNFNGGLGMPMGDFKDAAKMGFMGGVGASYMMSEAIALGVDGSFVMNDGSDDLNAFLTDVATTIEGTPTTVTGKTSMITGGAHAMYMFPMSGESKISPYALVGLGIYNLKAKTESSNASYAGDASDSKFGGRGGLGLSYKASENVGVGLEGTMHYISTEGSSTTFLGIQAVVTVAMSKSQ